ncbi:MAG: transglutaminase domain-containing protein [Candidatus Omnitrophica bacterium]|nr:transglutaminase domain-containing protein [Candidatus Omnitrophota bacterium]
MKVKRLIKIISLLIGLLLCVAVLNLPVITKQGVNYVVSTKKVPLYLKTLGFFYRHFACKQLVSEIIKEPQTDKNRILAIFKWTHENIKQNIPKNYPIVDDHVLDIIIRRYGTPDQFQDVFTTLCSYAGFKAFWFFIEGDNARLSRTPISLVQLDGTWLVFDSYRGNYFLNDRGEIASAEDIRNDLSICSNIVNFSPFIESINYSKYLKNLDPVGKISITRGEYQIPGKRILYKIKSLLNMAYR